MRATTVIFAQVFYFASVILTFCRMSLGAKLLESASLTDVSSQSDDVACFNFTKGNPLKKEFYSPNYPNEYPKNVKCTFRITADVGHSVMVDFRDQFRLETSATCEYDSLEVRDGAYGYSPLIGKFCGNEFPIKLYSKGRYMWLHFQSDETIQYEGFRAVYDYIPIPNQDKTDADADTECLHVKRGHSGTFSKSEIDHLWPKFKQDETIECTWTIETDAGKKLYINFLKYQLDRPNDCDQNFLQIFDFERTPLHSLATFCGTTAEPQKTKTNVTHVRLFTNRDSFNGTMFTLHFTSFREMASSKEKCDPNTEFNCNDQTCVDISLKCNGEFDCKYRYDEDPSICLKTLGASMVLTSEHMIVILVVFFSLVIAMCASISISCYNKVRERQLREREYKERRSKEASVEATLDRSTASSHHASASATAVAAAAALRGDDESSDGGCYVPEVDLSVFGQKQRSNGGDTIPKKLRNTPLQQQQQYPYISESFESLQSDVIVPPAPPPVPRHMKERREDTSPPPPNYRIVGGKVVAGDPPPWETPRTTQGYKRPEEPDPKSSWLRGPLEAGAPPRPSAFARPGLSSRVTPDSGPRGPLASRSFEPKQPGGYRPGAARNYPGRAEADLMPRPPTEASDSSRAHSVASTLSAPDALSAMQKR